MSYGDFFQELQDMPVVVAASQNSADSAKSLVEYKEQCQDMKSSLNDLEDEIKIDGYAERKELEDSKQHKHNKDSTP